MYALLVVQSVQNPLQIQAGKGFQKMHNFFYLRVPHRYKRCKISLFEGPFRKFKHYTAK